MAAGLNNDTFFFLFCRPLLRVLDTSIGFGRVGERLKGVPSTIGDPILRL